MVEATELSGPALFLARAPAEGLIVLRLRADDQVGHMAAAQALGVRLPLTPRRPSETAALQIYWTAPNAWLIATRSGGAADLLARLHGSLANQDAAVVEASDARTIFRISGAAARRLLARGTGVDLHPRAFKAGDVALTRFAGLSALLHQVSDEPAFVLYAERPAEHYLWTWLTDAAHEFGVPANHEESASTSG